MEFHAHIPKNIYKNRACACLFSLFLINVDQMNLSFMLMMFLPGNCMPLVTYIMLWCLYADRKPGKRSVVLKMLKYHRMQHKSSSLQQIQSVCSIMCIIDWISPTSGFKGLSHRKVNVTERHLPCTFIFYIHMYYFARNY